MKSDKKNSQGYIVMSKNRIATYTTVERVKMLKVFRKNHS